MADAAPVPVPGASIDARYDGFNIVTVNYKHVNGVGIPVSILIPENLPPGQQHPVAVRWHGGGFGTGHRLYAEWTLSIYRNNCAIALSPDYRLLPEATGLDILSDAQDFYTWLFTPGNLSRHLPPNTTPSLSSILVTGESAGGWHALQAGLLHPDRISAIISHYPMIDLRSRHFSSPPPPPKQIFCPPRPQADPEALDDYVANLNGDEVVPSRLPPDGEVNVLVMIQQGLYGKYFGTDERLHPLEMVDKAAENVFPPTWILHGTNDSVVPVSGTRMFVEKMREKWPGVPLHVTYREGAEHGFDLRDDGQGWREEGVQFIEKFWPAREEV